MTLVGSEMLNILEYVLPKRFGGSALDYQLVEEEDAQGFTRLTLNVAPSVSLPPDEAVIKVIMAELRKGSHSADLARAFWSQDRTLQIRRTEPVWTERGKLLPLHLSRLQSAGTSNGRQDAGVDRS
jgi:hypothetical protein